MYNVLPKLNKINYLNIHIVFDMIKVEIKIFSTKIPRVRWITYRILPKLKKEVTLILLILFHKIKMKE